MTQDVAETLDLAGQKAILLACVGPARPMPGADVLAALGEGDWLAIDAMAAQHRLRPWLHHRKRSGALDCDIPDDIAAGWRETYRAGAIGALTAQAALVRMARALTEQGVTFAALKGARLAFFDYAEAALRPMRDLDILVREADLEPALEALGHAGCDLPDDRAAAIARALDGDKHLDPILLPDCDRYIELHHRIAEPGLPCIPAGDIIAQARTGTLGGTAVPFPCPEHMLGHLVLHAVYNHRFDCGPLALVDIAMLLEREKIDPVRFAAMAENGGWLPGARLVIALVERVMGPAGLAIGQHEVPENIIAGAEDLLLQDFDQRAQVALASQSARSGVAATLLSRLRKGMRHPGEEGRLRWLSSRASRTMRQAGDSRSRAEAASGASVVRWLQAAAIPNTDD